MVGFFDVIYYGLQTIIKYGNMTKLLSVAILT